MLRNYFQTALRQLIRYRSSNVINILGLAFGMACCIMCFVHIRFEYSFDGFHENGSRIFRIVTGDPATTQSWVKMAAPVPPKVKSLLPEVEEFVRVNSVSWSEKVAIESNGQQFLEPFFLMADPSFFNVFNYPLVKGNAADVLTGLNNIVIAESVAKKLFGTEDPIGRIITLKDNKIDFAVAGVMKDFPANSHLRIDYLISFENIDNVLGEGRRDAWREFNYFSYLMLSPLADPIVVQQKMQAISVDIPGQEALSLQDLRLQPLEDIHFQHNRGNQLPSYDKRYIYIFITLAIAVLVIAAMNYFNLATMLSMRRVKEIGVRKSAGASASQLTRQLMLENIAIVTLSMLLAVVLVKVLTPVVNAALTSPLDVNYLDPLLLTCLVGLVLLLGVGSGSYLAIYVSNFRAAAILKGMVTKSTRGGGVQQSLIGIQFALSLILICSSVVITRQMHFITTKDLGFEQDQVITLSLSRDLSPALATALKTELSQSNHVAAVACSDFTPGRANWHQTAWWEGQAENEDAYMYVMTADQQFLPALRMEITEGDVRGLESESERQYVINESARDYIGWDNAVGRMISPFGESAKGPVAAVVKDFHYTSLHTKVEPLIIAIYKERRFSKLHVRLKGGNLQEGIAAVKTIFENVAGNQPLEFAFMDESIGRLYQAEMQLGKVVLGLTAIAVLFALLGIYTLISFSIENRTKEIAIRKVLGISTGDLIALFSTHYFKLAMLAAVVAVPVCWLLLDEWLSRFTYHIALNAWWFLASVLTVFACIALIAYTKYFSMRKVNPAHSLKYE